MILISIIVPIYNVEPYLAQCIESLLNQTYSNIEILLVDDGSGDQSVCICDDYKKKDTRIKVIHQKNVGIAAARNVGIENSSGKYFLFVDGDDYVDEHYVEMLYQYVEKSPNSIAICGYFTVDGRERKKEWTGADYEQWSQTQFWEHYYGKLAVFCISPCNKIYSRELFVNLRYETGRLHEDEFILYDLINTCQNITICPKCLYYYRQRDSSIMHTYNVKRLDAVDALLDRYCCFWNQREYKFAEKTIRCVIHIMLEFYKKSSTSEEKRVYKQYKRKFIKTLQSYKIRNENWMRKIYRYLFFCNEDICVMIKKICTVLKCNL